MTRPPLLGAMTEMIAVVDPDPAVRHSLEFALRTEGYRVATFAHGQDLLTSMHGPLACVISEYRLADMTGFDLIGKIREIQQEVHFVLLVTCPDRHILRRAHDENARIVEKPLLGNTLLDELSNPSRGFSVQRHPNADRPKQRTDGRSVEGLRRD